MAKKMCPKWGGGFTLGLAGNLAFFWTCGVFINQLTHMLCYRLRVEWGEWRRLILTLCRVGRIPIFLTLSRNACHRVGLRLVECCCLLAVFRLRFGVEAGI
jgi:hypothetical protein